MSEKYNNNAEQESGENDEISDILSVCRLLDVSSHTISELAKKGIITAQMDGEKIVSLDRQSVKILLLELNRYERDEEKAGSKNKTWLTFDQTAATLEITTEELNLLRQDQALLGYFNQEQVQFKSGDVRRACLKKWSNEVKDSVESAMS